MLTRSVLAHPPSHPPSPFPHPPSLSRNTVPCFPREEKEVDERQVEVTKEDAEGWVAADIQNGGACAACCLLPAACCLLRQLPAACCASCLLRAAPAACFPACRLPPAACRLLPAACCQLPASPQPRRSPAAAPPASPAWPSPTRRLPRPSPPHTDDGVDDEAAAPVVETAAESAPAVRPLPSAPPPTCARSAIASLTTRSSALGDRRGH